MSEIHFSSSPHIAVDVDGDDSSTSMDFQAGNDPLMGVNGICKDPSTTPNTLQQTLMEIAQQKLINPGNRNQNEKIIRCKNNNDHSGMTEKKKNNFLSIHH